MDREELRKLIMENTVSNGNMQINELVDKIIELSNHFIPLGVVARLSTLELALLNDDERYFVLEEIKEAFSE